MKNKKIIILTGLIAIITFGGVIDVERNLSISNPTTNVLVAKHNIKKGSLLASSDFKMEKRFTSDVTQDMVKSESQIEDKYAIENIYKEDAVNTNRIVSKDDSRNPYLSSNKVEFSIPLTSLNNDTFAGTLRQGDIVEVSYVENKNVNSSDSSSNSSSVPKKLEVLGAVDAQGKFLDSSDRNAVASAVMFSGSKQDFESISEKIPDGTFKLAKCSLKNTVNN